MLPPPPPPPVIYMFGFPAALPIEPHVASLVERFLSGETLEPTAELLALLKREFDAQERYRRTLAAGIERVSSALLAEASRHIATIEHPFIDTLSAFWRGYNAGRYQALAIAASMLAELVIVASMEVER